MDTITTELTGEQREWLFKELWQPHNALNKMRQCVTCGAFEGECVEESCMRLSVTHTLGIQPHRS